MDELAANGVDECAVAARNPTRVSKRRSEACARVQCPERDQGRTPRDRNSNARKLCGGGERRRARHRGELARHTFGKTTHTARSGSSARGGGGGGGDCQHSSRGGNLRLRRQLYVDALRFRRRHSRCLLHAQRAERAPTFAILRHEREETFAHLPPAHRDVQSRYMGTSFGPGLHSKDGAGSPAKVFADSLDDVPLHAVMNQLRPILQVRAALLAAD